MKKIFCLFYILMFLFANLYSQSVSNDILTKVKESKFIENTFLSDDKIELTLTPDTELSKQAVGQWTNSEKPCLTTEKLFYLDKKDLGNDSSIEKVSKVIRSISTMKGTEYYSNRHKKWETLYHEAHLINNPDDKKAIKDDIEGSADGKVLYCMQDDNSFGKCYYKLSYKQREKEISVCFDNFEPLKFGFITAAKAHNVNINLVIVDEGEYFLVYLIVQANYPRIAMLENKMIDSFNARVDSIYNWFFKQMKAE